MTLSAHRPSPPVALTAATVIATSGGGRLGLTLFQPEWFPAVPILLAGLGLIALAGIVLIDAGTNEPSAIRALDEGKGGEDGGGPPLMATSFADPLRAPPQTETTEDQATERQAQPPICDVRMALPVPSVQWWGRGTTSVLDAVAEPHDRHVPPPELETYLETSVIAQCPRCGAFHLDAQADPPGYRFGCRTCGSEWDWQPGRPWPAVRVNPRRRRPDAVSAAEP